MKSLSTFKAYAELAPTCAVTSEELKAFVRVIEAAQIYIRGVNPTKDQLIELDNALNYFDL